jgi:tetratricopeptide (TPR) repeat protein
MRPSALSRREALAALAASAAGFAAQAPKADPKSLVGETVLPRGIDVLGQATAPRNERPLPGLPPGTCPLTATSYTVKAEKGTTILVLHEDGARLWVEKADVVLLADAVEFFTARTKENPRDAFPFNSRGWAHYLLGEHKKAVADFDEYLRRAVPPGVASGVTAPYRHYALANRGLVLAEMGEFDKALKDLDEAAAPAPGYALALVNRGYCRELMGEFAKAVEDYQTAAAIPAFAITPSPTLAINNRAWVLATCPDAKVRDGAKAVELARKACERTDNLEGMYLDTLAAALAEAGQFDEAVKAQEKALEDRSYAKRYGDEGRARLKLYQQKKPFRTDPPKK